MDAVCLKKFKNLFAYLRMNKTADYLSFCKQISGTAGRAIFTNLVRASHGKLTIEVPQFHQMNKFYKLIETIPKEILPKNCTVYRAVIVAPTFGDNSTILFPVPISTALNKYTAIVFLQGKSGILLKINTLDSTYLPTVGGQEDGEIILKPGFFTITKSHNNGTYIELEGTYESIELKNYREILEAGVEDDLLTLRNDNLSDYVV